MYQISDKDINFSNIMNNYIMKLAAGGQIWTKEKSKEASTSKTHSYICYLL